MTSVNLTNAFFLTQLFLLVIIYLGMVVLQRGEKRISPLSENPRPTAILTSLLLGFALVTIGILVFTEDVVVFSRPVFGDLDFPSIGKSTAFLVVFSFDLLGAAVLILVTGGSKNSPFSAVLFMLPALAIFLREPPERFLSYTFAAAILFLLVQTDAAWRVIQENPNNKRAYAVVTLGCLAISTLVGYATRPI